MPIADGSNQSGLRHWLERVEVIPTLTVEEAERGLPRYRQGYCSRPSVHILPGLVQCWLGHLGNSCTSAREGERLVQEVDTYRQGSYQPMVEYVATFRDRVNRAYTPEDMANAKIAHHR